MAQLVWLASLLLVGTPTRAATNLSAWILPAPTGRLLYQPDALGNRILDASGVGYKGGTAPLPTSNTVPVKAIVSPVAGDNVSNIQSAINFVSAQPLDTNGFRGAVLLTAGEYPCASTITIHASGVVLRGVGSFTNGTGTVLRATATNQYTLLAVSGTGSASSGTSRTITNRYVPTGARSFYVDNTSGLSVGAEVFVRRVATSNWIHDLGMDLLGPPPDVPWTPSGYHIDMDRVITHIEGNHIFVDAPITCAIDTGYTNGTIRPFTWNGLITNVGVEHIYAKSDYFGSTTNETHGWTFIQFDKLVNGWVRDVASQFFGYSCVNLNSGVKFVTVQDCQSLDPISIITGGRRYAFAINDCQYCLVKNCYDREDRHQFVTQSLTIGPSVFVDGQSDNAHAEAGPHQRWATGILWDRITVNGGNNDIQNAGNFGTGHGWEGATCVIWNNTAKGFIVQNPPMARNWLIGSIGPIQNGTAYVGPHDPGTYDSSGTAATNVFPNSLYFAQLQDRLAAPNLQTRDYWIGEIDGFTNASPAGEIVPVNSAWRSAVQAAAGGKPPDAFDVVTNNHWVPFTFNFSLGANEHVVAATLSLALRATNSASGDVLYLNSTTNSFTFAGIGWLPIATSTNTTVRVMDLLGQLDAFTNGLFNVAVQGDIGVDWAMLELQIAPNSSAGTLTLSPVADATVRGGTFAGINFGTTNTLTVKNDSSADNTRQAYLRWDLSSVTQKVTQARIVLTPVGVGADAIEQGVAVADNDTWTETGLTWNNQPGAGERFANWIPGTGAPVSFDVTPQVLDAFTGTHLLSVQLFSVRNVGAAGIVDYASREYADPNSRPRLVLSINGSSPTISALTNRTIAVNASTGPMPLTVGSSMTGPDSLVLSGDSSNPALVPDTNILSSGSGSNRTATVNPATNQSGATTITITVTDTNGLSASTSFILTVSSHPPTTIVWNGPGAGANNWSTAGNWSPVELPEAFDDVKFFDPGANGVAVGAINNIVDLNFGGTIASAQFANTNGNHTTFIATGQTLTLNGDNGLIIGTETDNGTAQTVFTTITGPGGELVLDNSSADLIVRQGTANSGGSQRATLDLSGLGSFTANLDRILVGVIGPVNRATGTLFLGQANALATSGDPGILIGDNNSNGGGQNFLYLGQDNEIFTDSITIARQKAAATMRFNPAFANPSAVFRAAAGAGRVSTWNIADHSLQSTSSSTSSGTNDFSGGTVDAQVDTLTIAKSQKTTGANSFGVLTFTAGTIDVNTLQVGFQTQSGATSAGIGRVNVNSTNAILIVNSLLELGHTSGGAGTTNTSGTLAINGGAASVNEIDCGPGSGTNALLVSNGTLDLTTTAGSVAVPIGIVALTNSILQLAVDAGATNVVAASLTTGGSSNRIDIASLPDLTAARAQFPLIQYAGTIRGAGFNFVLGPLPADVITVGYLSNNAAAKTVDLVVAAPAGPPRFAGISLTGNFVVLSGTDGVAGWPYYVLATTNVALPANLWQRIATNIFDGAGNFQFTNSLDPSAAQQFFQLRLL